MNCSDSTKPDIHRLLESGVGNCAMATKRGHSINGFNFAVHGRPEAEIIDILSLRLNIIWAFSFEATQRSMRLKRRQSAEKKERKRLVRCFSAGERALTKRCAINNKRMLTLNWHSCPPRNLFHITITFPMLEKNWRDWPRRCPNQTEETQRLQNYSIISALTTFIPYTACKWVV